MLRLALFEQSGTHSGTETGVLAEIASLQLEYTYLSKLTGRRAHFDRVSKPLINVFCFFSLVFIGEHRHESAIAGQFESHRRDAAYQMESRCFHPC